MKKSTIRLMTLPISYAMGRVIGACGKKLINENDSAMSKLMINLGCLGFSYMSGYAFGKVVDRTLDDLEAGGVTFE